MDETGLTKEPSVEDEIIGLRRELGEREIEECDVCGRPVPKDELKLVPVERGMGEPEEVLRMCSECVQAMEAEELPVEAELTPELAEGEE
jgi:hypothetical protein